MTAERNVEVVRNAYEAFNRRDFDAALASAADDVTWRPLFSVETPLLRGKNEIRAAWARQVEALDLRVEIKELVALGDSRVLAVARWTGRGVGSGAPVEATAAQLVTLERGRAISTETYATKAEALAAAEREEA
jgi:ketosteroid isomerase-like protein